MFTLRRLKRRLCALFPGKFEQEMDEELRFHLESTIQANIQSGMPEKEARRAALISFGGLDRTKEDCRDISWARPAEQLWRDLKFGFRMIRKYPGFTVSAVLILALGIGEVPEGESEAAQDGLHVDALFFPFAHEGCSLFEIESERAHRSSEMPVAWLARNR